MKRFGALLLSAIISGCSLLGGEFINLGFDSPVLEPPPAWTHPLGPYTGNAAQLLAGWRVRIDGAPADLIGFLPADGSGSLGGVRMVTLREHVAGSGERSFDLRLFGAPDPNAGDIRIMQSGTVPFEASVLGLLGNGPVEVFANGMSRGRFYLESNPWVDLSDHAGESVFLELAVSAGERAVLDVRGFAAVPEPSVVALGVAGLFVGWACSPQSVLRRLLQR